MTIYVGVNRTASRKSWALHIAEALVHETFETYWQMPHSVAVVAELLVSERNVPTRILRQIEASRDDDLLAMEVSSDALVLDVLCFVPGIEEVWDSVPEAARRVFVALLEAAFPSPHAEVVTETAVRTAAGLSLEEYKDAVTHLVNRCAHARILGDPRHHLHHHAGKEGGAHRWQRRYNPGGKGTFSKDAFDNAFLAKEMPAVSRIPFRSRTVLLQLSAMLSINIKHAARATLDARYVTRTEERNPIDRSGISLLMGVGHGRDSNEQ